MIVPRTIKLIAFLLLALTSTSAYCFDRIVIFGDSLSDTGNLASGFSLPPPYFQNRISNGPVAVDRLAARFGLNANTAGQLFGGSGDNYAVAGGNAAGSDPEDLAAQITAFRLGNTRAINAETLFLIMVGGNDLRDARNFGSAATRSAIVAQAVDAIANAVTTLDGLGAKHILIGNGPDISRIPETLILSTSDPAVVSRAGSATSLFNSSLDIRLSSLQNSVSSKLSLFDLFTEFNRVLNNPAQFGLSVVDRACFDPRRFRLNSGCDFDQFVFFDSIHPTAKAHRILGDALFARAKSIKITMSPAIAGAIILLLE